MPRWGQWARRWVSKEMQRGLMEMPQDTRSTLTVRCLLFPSALSTINILVTNVCSCLHTRNHPQCPEILCRSHEAPLSVLSFDLCQACRLCHSQVAKSFDILSPLPTDRQPGRKKKQKPSISPISVSEPPQRQDHWVSKCPPWNWDAGKAFPSSLEWTEKCSFSQGHKVTRSNDLEAQRKAGEFCRPRCLLAWLDGSGAIPSSALTSSVVLDHNRASNTHMNKQVVRNRRYMMIIRTGWL